MKLWFAPPRWSIASRLLVLALLPTALMLVAGNAAMYWISLHNATTEVRERGRFVAAALAEGSRYAVVSGQIDSVQRSIRNLMDADLSLAGVQLLDRTRRVVVDLNSIRTTGEGVDFEMEIASEPLNVDTFDVLDPANAANRRPGPPLGYVRVRMTAGPIVSASVERLAAGSAVVLVSTIVSLGIALTLAGLLGAPLKDVMHAVRRLQRGQFDIHMRPGATGELAELQSAVIEMALGLQLTHDRLEREVAARTLALGQAMERIRLSDVEKGRLIARGNELVEDERRRISTEIHDDLNAVIVSIRMHAESLASAAGDAGQHDMQVAASRIVNLADTIYARARAIIRKLRPEILDALGLKGAVEETVRAFAEADRGCAVELAAGPLPVLGETVSIAAYRMLQEALSNVAKHASAKHCAVSLRAASGDRLSLVVEDDGRGFDPSVVVAGGLGLAGMRERAAALGGDVAVQSAPGKGARITITLPMHPA